MINNILELLRTFALRTDPDRVFDAEQALQQLGEAAIHALIESLNDSDEDLRILALQILEHIDQNTEPALPAMINALKDPDRNVRIAALTPIASFGAKAIDAVPILEKWIGSDDEFSHVSAVGHILMIDSTRSKELMPVLIKSLKSDDFGIRCQTVWLLGQLGELAKEAMPELKRLLNDDGSSVQGVAAEAIRDITDNDPSHVAIRN
ncbi:HEAT repeat domain-containing protein [Gimesia algae]|uniref:HEAT repeat protein n=1 Tax=Gimesia algae TaxID=2527971 RepID=A0A517VFK3_9PLAN|nr:HEAT repeat domain-containing protein [Gimesia algae]QDT91766.1 HEAT repeat protein [Gimesia algae]